MPPGGIGGAGGAGRCPPLDRVRRGRPAAKARRRAVGRGGLTADPGGRRSRRRRGSRGRWRPPRARPHVLPARRSRRRRGLRAVARCVMAQIRAVISDFGGVLTTPLMGSFAAFQDETGIPPSSLGAAMQRIGEREGEHPLFELERGRITETDFLDALRVELATDLGHEPELHRFSEIYFDALEPNQPMVDTMRDLKGRGYRMALLTNNVREWEPLWRGMLPVDEIFEIVVDSAFVGMRKPEPAIYALAVERIGGGIGATDCLFVDDVEDNVAAARELG